MRYPPALVVAKRPSHRLRYMMHAECRLAASGVGVIPHSSRCMLSHLASPLQRGCVTRWSDVSFSSYAPSCMALSHQRIGGRRMLAAADEAGVVALFDPTASAEGLPRFSCDAQPHSVTVHDMKWACDDSFFASASADGTLVINSFANSRLVPVVALKTRPTASHFEPPVKSVACHPSSPSILASGNRHGTLSTWDIRSPETQLQSGIARFPNAAARYCPALQSTHHPFPSEARSLTGVDFLDDVSLISCCADGRICLWDVRNSSQPFMAQEASNSKLRALSCARVSPCRTRVAFASALGFCFVQTLPSLTNDNACTVVPISPHRSLYFGAKLDWSPCGRFLACSTLNKAVAIVDMQLGLVVMKLNGHIRRVADVTWLKDMTGLLSLAKDGQIRLWNPTMRKVEARAQ